MSGTVTVKLGDRPAEVLVGPGQGRSLYVGPEPPAGLPGIRVDHAAELDWRALDALESLADLHYAGDDETLVRYLAGRPGISSLSWAPATLTSIDPTATSLTRLVLTNAGTLETVALPEATHFLSLVGVVAGLRVSSSRSPASELGLTCQFSRVAAVEPVAGLEDAARSVTVWQCGSLDLRALEAHAAMRDLHVVETPVEGLEALTRLPGLRAVWLQDCYDLDLSGLPATDSLAGLEELRLDGVREADADQVRVRWDPHPRVKVQRARSVDWLLKNHDDPFREWGDEAPDGTAGRTATGATRAWRGALTALAKAAPDDGDGARAALSEFVEAFNALDERHHDIDTIRAEQIAEAFELLVTRHPALTPDDHDRIFERLRSF